MCDWSWTGAVASYFTLIGMLAGFCLCDYLKGKGEGK
jgi:hypothetical protein